MWFVDNNKNTWHIVIRRYGLKVCDHSPVLHHDVLVRHQAVVAVETPLPPVMWRSLEELQGRSLLEGELAARPAHIVEPRHRLHSLPLCQRDRQTTEEEEEEERRGGMKIRARRGYRGEPELVNQLSLPLCSSHRSTNQTGALKAGLFFY